MPSNTVLVSGPAVGEAQTLIWSYSCVFLPPMCTDTKTSAFSFVGALSMTFYIFHRHRACLVDHVDLIFSLCSCWEDFGSSSLATLPLGFNCGFISTSTCGLSTGVCVWGCPGGPGFAPVRARCGGGAAAWVAGVLEAPGHQGRWQLGKQEIQWSCRVWQPVLANTLQYSCLENPLPWQRSLAGHSLQSQTLPKRPCAHRHKTFLPVAALPQWELSMKVAQLLGLRGLWTHQVCRDILCCRSYGPIRVFFFFFESLVAGNQKASMASVSP